MTDRIRIYTYKVNYLIRYNLATLETEPVFLHTDVVRAKNGEEAEDLVRAKNAGCVIVFLNARRSPYSRIDGITSIKPHLLTKRQIETVLKAQPVVQPTTWGPPTTYVAGQTITFPASGYAQSTTVIINPSDGS